MKGGGIAETTPARILHASCLERLRIAVADLQTAKAVSLALLARPLVYHDHPASNNASTWPKTSRPWRQLTPLGSIRRLPNFDKDVKLTISTDDHKTALELSTHH